MRRQFTAGQCRSRRAERISQVLVSLLVASVSGCTPIITDNSLPWEHVPNLLQQKSMMRHLHSSEFPVCIKENTAANPECRRVFRKGAGYQLDGRTSIQRVSPNEPVLTLTNTRVSGTPEDFVDVWNFELPSEGLEGRFIFCEDGKAHIYSMEFR